MLPALVCFYSSGLSPATGRKSLQKFLAAAAAVGLKDQLVLDHFNTYECATWESYVAVAGDKVKTAFGASRPLLLVGHSFGALAALGLARHFSAQRRVRKIYVIGSRPPNAEKADTKAIFGVASEEALAEISLERFLGGLVGSWGHRLLGEFVNVPKAEWPPGVRETIQLLHMQFTSSVMREATSRDQLEPLACPIMAIAASRESPMGETAERMQAWRSLTSADFRLASVDADHHDILQPLPALVRGKLRVPLYTLLLEDMLGQGVDEAILLQAVREVVLSNMSPQARKHAEAMHKSREAGVAAAAR